MIFQKINGEVSSELQYLVYQGALPFPFDLERAIDDWVFLCFFVGNDFLPRMASLDIREGGIDRLVAIWKKSLPVLGGYLTEKGVSVCIFFETLLMYK